MDLKLNFISLLGVFGFCFIAWISSENRKNIPWTFILWGLGIQFSLSLLFFVFPLSMLPLIEFNNMLGNLNGLADAGSRFLFGSSLVPDYNNKLPPLINEITGELEIQKLINPNTNQIPSSRISFGYIFAIRSLPSLIFFSAIISLGYRLGLVQFIVKIFAKIFQSKVKVSGAESLACLSNIFFGFESLLLIRPYLNNMTRSELLTILTCSFASISSTVFGMYAGFLRPTLPNASEHLMLASLLTIPACFILSKIIIPETEVPATYGDVPLEATKVKQETYLGALFTGGFDGAKVVLGIIIGMISVLGLVYLLNSIFTSLASLQDSSFSLTNLEGRIFKLVSLDNIFGVLFLPFTFLTGISLDMNELWQSSILIGQRFLQTSIPPYLKLGEMSRVGEISDRAMIIITYVLCGFVHVPAIGIFIGGLSRLVPSRFDEICSLTWKALWAATLATLMTGAFAGLFALGAKL